MQTPTGAPQILPETVDRRLYRLIHGLRHVFALATGVAATRVHLGHHFPGDTVVGGLIGIATGTLAAWLIKAT